MNFKNLKEAQDEEEMAYNIQCLIDLLSHKILKYDLSHIRGADLIAGHPDHCINLLQLAKEISSMMASSQIDGTGFNQEDDSQFEE